jgi:hypothetical protein
LEATRRRIITTLFEARSREGERYIKVDQVGGEGRKIWYQAHYGEVSPDHYGIEGARYSSDIKIVKKTVVGWLKDEAYLTPPYTILTNEVRAKREAI